MHAQAAATPRQRRRQDAASQGPEELSRRAAAPAPVSAPGRLRVRNIIAGVVVVLACLPAAAIGQHLAQPSPLGGRGQGEGARPPAGAPAPLLYVRVVGPPGLKATFYQGRPEGREFPAPVTVGLRPGYIYRLKLVGFPEQPPIALYPTLEVRGTLQLPPGLHAADYPAPIFFNAEDIERVLRGAVVTKVIVLEHPSQAIPIPAEADRPLEVEARPGEEAVTEARSRGRPLLIVRLGERDFTAEELAGQSLPGTILLPGEKTLPPPAAPTSTLPQNCGRGGLGCFPPSPSAKVGGRPGWGPFYDPLLGPRPAEEECLHDGGDVGRPAGVDREGRLHGVDPSDSVAAYTNSRGQRRVAVSNRICICVPRFVVVRSEMALERQETVVQLASTERLRTNAALRTGLPSRQLKTYEQVEGLVGRERPSSNVSTRRLDLLVEEAGPAVVGRIAGVSVVGSLVESRAEAPRPTDKPLVLHKWVGAQAANVGDVITLYLQYVNIGGQPITDVAVSDSLTGRLEYIPGSARSDRDAVFTTQPNEAGSLLLHWEIRGPLLPGQSGTISFEARVR